MQDDILLFFLFFLWFALLFCIGCLIGEVIWRFLRFLST